MSSISRKILSGLTADRFRHPIDEQATRSLQQLPGLGLLIQTLMAPAAEQIFYLDNIASSLQVGPKQLPDLFRLLLDACHILDIEPPQLYVKQNPSPNAYTFAMQGKQPFIVVHTSLLDLLEPLEVQAVLAHELGHLKCNHGVYLTMANILMLSASLIPFGTLLQQSLQEQLMQWVQCAEFSCDRAALLVAQESKTVVSVLMKLCGGSPQLSSQLNVDAFLEQARTYSELDRDDWQVMLKRLQNAGRSHPVPVLRAREIDRWFRSNTYEQLMSA
ncbi:M48 family metallopeptidase [Synechococcus sp. PCC 7336]|uniref:M48 family metallopeptidase n=1 Tax=Synechococcus sp. PCC 7336 TaxID=195250 RepID=UPI0003489E17|nr:M48 family metallopeptidase [Synechococcus sp. PCC 7336]